MEKKNINEVVAENLRRRMKDCGVVQTELARRSGVPQTTISLYLSPGRRNSSASGKQPSGKLVEVEAMAAALGATLGEMVADKADPGAGRKAQPAPAQLGAGAVAQLLGEALRDLSPSRRKTIAMLVAAQIEDAPNESEAQAIDALAPGVSLSVPAGSPADASASIDRAFREAFYRLAGEMRSKTQAALINEIRDSVEHEVAKTLQIDAAQARRALVERQSHQG